MNTPAQPQPLQFNEDSNAPRQRLKSDELFRGSNAVEIEHDGKHYLLRITRENKLILTK